MSNENPIAPYDRQSDGGVIIVPVRQCMDLSRCGDRIVTSLDVGTVQGRRDLRRHLMGSELQGKDDHINGVLDLSHVTAHAASSVDPATGQVSDFVRVVLQLADNKLVSFGSRGILKSLMIIAALERCPPWVPPLRCTLRQRALADGRIWLELEPVDDGPPDEPARKKKSK